MADNDRGDELVDELYVGGRNLDSPSVEEQVVSPVDLVKTPKTAGDSSAPAAQHTSLGDEIVVFLGLLALVCLIALGATWAVLYGKYGYRVQTGDEIGRSQVEGVYFQQNGVSSIKITGHGDQADQGRYGLDVGSYKLDFACETCTGFKSDLTPVDSGVVAASSTSDRERTGQTSFNVGKSSTFTLTVEAGGSWTVWISEAVT